MNHWDPQQGKQQSGLQRLQLNNLTLSLVPSGGSVLLPYDSGNNISTFSTLNVLNSVYIPDSQNPVIGLLSTGNLFAKSISTTSMNLFSDAEQPSYLVFNDLSGNLIGGIFNNSPDLSIGSIFSLNLLSQEKDINILSDKGSVLLGGISSASIVSQSNINITSANGTVYIKGQNGILFDGVVGVASLTVDGDLKSINLSTGSAYIDTLSTNNFFTNYISSGTG